jgi:hypothetical protein
MEEELVSERAMSVEEYLAHFAEGSADFELVKQRSAAIKSILQRTLRDASGATFVDTVFHEKNGVSYTIRARL